MRVSQRRVYICVEMEARYRQMLKSDLEEILVGKDRVDANELSSFVLA